MSASPLQWAVTAVAVAAGAVLVFWWLMRHRDDKRPYIIRHGVLYADPEPELPPGYVPPSAALTPPVCPKCGTSSCLEDKALDW